METDNLRSKFWLFLYSQGFPQSINDESLRLASMKIEAQACKGKRLRLKGWSFCFGGLHSDDIALISLLTGELGLKQGIDWDWGLESDDYHFEVAYINNSQVMNLLKLLDLYYSESLIFTNARLLMKNSEHLEIERKLSEERMKLEKWKETLEIEFLRKLNDFLKEKGGR